MTPFGLYVHWPFCQAKCPYCDFNSHVTANVDQQRWADALCSELRRYRRETGPRTLRSIFFGGGTPSLMQPETVGHVLDIASKLWGFASDIEISLEANPTSVEGTRFDGYRAAGVNRVSIGVQSLNDRDLKRLGRLHSVEEALGAIEQARHTFDRVSFDLIYARQDQSVADWTDELTRAIDLGPDHISLYQLTLEPGTAFFDRWTRGKLSGMPGEDLGADLWYVTQDICASAGLPAYEISNHARPGAKSLHNLIYWRSHDWIGVGPGAHGRFTSESARVATEAISAPGAWLKAVETNSNVETERTTISDAEHGDDILMMGLRLTEGVDLTRLSKNRRDELLNNINGLSSSGVVALKGNILSATASGRPILNEILRQLLTGQADI